MARIALWAGTAGFALGLSLAGVYTAAVASAESPKADSSKADSAASAGPARATPKPRSRPAAARGPAPKPAASTRPVVSPPARGVAATPASAVAPLNAVAAPTAPSITIHNTSKTQPIWVYNLTNTGNYSIPATPWQAEPPSPAPPLPADWVGPVEIAADSSAPVTLAVFNAPAGSPGNRIYIVDDAEFTLPVTATSGVDPFYPPGSPGTDAFSNYSFLEYSLYPAAGGYEYTIDVSYIDEWSLPLQAKFTKNGADWNGAVSGKTYGFNDFDTVKSQLNAAGGPYGDLVWSGPTPWDPQPPSTVSRIIGPDKVWTAQSGEPATNFNMNNTGWVPTSYQNFVQFGSYTDPRTKQLVYPYAYNGTGVSCPPSSCTATPTTQTNFDFWRYQVSTPGSTPYPIALRTAAILDGFATADANGVYGFFTYPDDEAAGQFTNIPTAVSLDVYVGGSADGLSDSVIPGGVWNYTSSVAQKGILRRILQGRPHVSGTDATDTFILNYAFRNTLNAPLVNITSQGDDIAVIDRAALGATSTTIDVVDRARFLCGCNPGSQFVYERSTGTLYYDKNPRLPGFTAVLGKFSGVTDPLGTLFVL